MEKEPLRGVKSNMSELRRLLDTLKREDEIETRRTKQIGNYYQSYYLNKQKIPQIENDIQRIESTLELKEKSISEIEQKLKQYDSIVGQSENALIKLTQNAMRFYKI